VFENIKRTMVLTHKDLSLDCGQVFVIFIIDGAMATALGLVVNILLSDFTHDDPNYYLINIIVNSSGAAMFAGMAIGFGFLARYLSADTFKQAYVDSRYIADAKTQAMIVITVFTSFALTAFGHFVTGNFIGWTGVSSFVLLVIVVSQLVIIIALFLTYFFFFSTNALVTFARSLNEIQLVKVVAGDEDATETETAPLSRTGAKSTKLETPSAWF
jgi:hypothetical protein